MGGMELRKGLQIEVNHYHYVDARAETISVFLLTSALDEELACVIGPPSGDWGRPSHTSN